MKRMILSTLCLLPWLALGGCVSQSPVSSEFNPDLSLFGGDRIVPAAPDVVGVTAQNMALRQKVREGHGGQADVFVPLVEARAAVEAASSQPKVDAHAAGMLAKARAELQKAEQLWTGIADNEARKPSLLRRVASHAHTAKRLAQIARYTALRETNLAQVNVASQRLHRLQRQRAKARAASRQQSRNASGNGRRLIGKRVVPGPFGKFSFRPGTARLTDDSRSVIANLASLMKRYPSVGVAILGHTSTTEPSEQALAHFMSINPRLQKRDLSHRQKVHAYHLALSNARARAVARALVRAGVAPRRIGARGFGSRRPVASNETASGRAANERVIAVIIPGPGSENSPLRTGS